MNKKDSSYKTETDWERLEKMNDDDIDLSDMPELTEDDFNHMKPVYDFSDGVRGKHHRQLREGHSVTIYNEDGTKTVEQHDPDEGIIILDADIHKYFPDSDSVNRTLRFLINLIPQES